MPSLWARAKVAVEVTTPKLAKAARSGKDAKEKAHEARVNRDRRKRARPSIVGGPCNTATSTKCSGKR